MDLKAPDWLAYLVVMHLGTSIALFVYFWRDWLNFARSLVGAAGSRTATDRRTLFFVILATIPAVIVGALLRKLLGEIFAAPAIAAVFLIVNGFMLYFGDRIGEEAAGTLEQLNWKGALAIGVARMLRADSGDLALRLDHRRRRGGGTEARGGRPLFVPDGRADHSRRQRP